MSSFIGKIIPPKMKQRLIFSVNRFQWQKKQFPKLKSELLDDSIGYIGRCLGVDKKYLELKKLKNKFQGERCFIMATGPSLTLEDVELLKDEYTFGVNSFVNVLDEISYVPTFYAIQDGRAYEKLRDKIKAAPLKYAFIGNWKMKKEYFEDREWIRFPFSVWPYFTSYPEGDYVDKVKFTNNAYLRVCDGFSITYSAVQLATYMGFKKIYLLGNDCNYETGGENFAEYRDEKERMEIRDHGYNMILAYEVAKKWMDKHDVKIYNATRGGMLEVFERVKLEEVLASK